MTRAKTMVGVLALAILVLLPSQARATTFLEGDQTTGNLSTTEVVNGDGWFAGNEVTIDSLVMGELFAAGKDVTVREAAGRSMVLAGASVNAHGAAYNAYLAGSSVTLHGTYGNSVYVAGATVVIDKDAVIEGDLYVAGGVVTINGEVKGFVRAAVSQLDFAGLIGESLTGQVEKLHGKGGSVVRDIDISGRNIVITDQDKIQYGGAVRTHQLATDGMNAMVSMLFIKLLAFLVLIAVILWRFPKLSENITEQVLENQFSWIGRALVLMIVAPLVLIALFISVAGSMVAWIALLLFIVLWLLAIAQGVLVLSSVLSKRFPKLPNTYVLPMLLAVVIMLLQLVPGVGLLVSAILGVGYILPSFAAMAWEISKRR